MWVWVTVVWFCVGLCVGVEVGVGVCGYGWEVFVCVVGGCGMCNEVRGVSGRFVGVGWWGLW